MIRPPRQPVQARCDRRGAFGGGGIANHYRAAEQEATLRRSSTMWARECVGAGCVRGTGTPTSLRTQEPEARASLRHAHGKDATGLLGRNVASAHDVRTT